MPFPDESFAKRLRVLPHQPGWAEEGANLVARLRRLLPDAAAVDHIGSTSIPGMPAKDCIDDMVSVGSLNDDCRTLIPEGPVGAVVPRLPTR